MERIDKSISKDYLPLTIYRDDLEEIAVAFPSDAKISISTGDYKFASVAEFAEHTKADRIRDLEFTSSHPYYMTIEFGKTRAHVYVGSSAPLSAGVFFAVDRILNRNRRFLAWCYSFYFVWIICGLQLLSGILFNSKTIRASLSFWYPAIGSILLAALLWILYVRAFRHAVVIPRYRDTARGFLCATVTVSSWQLVQQSSARLRELFLPFCCTNRHLMRGARVIRVYDEAGNVIETHKHKGELKGP